MGIINQLLSVSPVSGISRDGGVCLSKVSGGQAGNYLIKVASYRRRYDWVLCIRHRKYGGIGHNPPLCNPAHLNKTTTLPNILGSHQPQIHSPSDQNLHDQCLAQSIIPFDLCACNSNNLSITLGFVGFRLPSYNYSP